MKDIWLVLLILIASFFLLSYRMTQVPPGINGDEASIANNAVLVAKTGRVEAGNRFPLFIPTGTDWKQPITFYSTVAAFKIFGPSYEALRGVSVFFALTSMVLIFFLAKEILGASTGIGAMLLFLATPLILIQSHLALENIAPIPFIVFWLWMLIRFTKLKEMKFLIFAGMALGAGVFSYYGMRLIVPILGLLTILYLRKPRSISAFLLGTLPFLLLLLWANGHYPGAVLGNNRPFWVNSYQQFFLPYISSFDPSFLFLKGDATIYHSTGTAGMFLLATLPLFVLGIAKAIKEKNSIYRFFLACFFISPILYGFVGESYRASRLLAIVPFYVLISTLGGTYLTAIKGKAIKILAIGGISLLIVVNYAGFAKDYWFSYPVRARKAFSSPWHSTYKVLDEKYKEGYRIYVLADMAGGGQDMKFFRAIYPFDLTVWKKGEEILPKSALLTYQDLLSSIEKNTLKEIYTNDFSQSIFLKE